MKDVILKNIYKSYGSEDILNNFSLTIPSQKFFALLGPSGCGKSTLLQLISGSHFPDSGSIFLGKNDITSIPSNLRKIHTVFQNYALFPHLNVYKNIAYGLEVKNLENIEIRKEVEKIAEIFSITKYLYKSVNSLSGGEQQRIAIARAIINQPEVLLLDEPLSALDMQLKDKMLRELIDLQDKYKMTFVYVTHNQNEAMAIADTIAIIDTKGKINQIGSPQEIYNNPQTSFVGKFFANTNQFPVKVEIYNDTVVLKSKKTDMIYHILPNLVKGEKGEGFLSIHAEKCFLSKSKILYRNFIEGKVVSIIYQGCYTEFFIDTVEGILRILYYSHTNNFYNKKVSQVHDGNITYDDIVYVSWNTEDVLFLEE